MTLHVTSWMTLHSRRSGTIAAYTLSPPTKEHAMSEFNVTSITSVDATAISDHNAIHRLFEMSAHSHDTQELAQLDALVYERLAVTYDDNTA